MLLLEVASDRAFEATPFPGFLWDCHIHHLKQQMMLLAEGLLAPSRPGKYCPISRQEALESSPSRMAIKDPAQVKRESNTFVKSNKSLK